MREKKINIIIGIFVVGWVLFSVIGIFFLWKLYNNDNGTFYSNTGDFKFQKFTSLEEMQDFLASADSSSSDYYSDDILMVNEAMPLASDSVEKLATTSEDSRSSETYVQVVGIDEADMVKTDGEHIFLASAAEYGRYDKPVFIENVEELIFEDSAEIDMDPLYLPKQAGVSILNTLPADTLEVIEEIDNYGDLLLVEDYLIVLGQESIVAYNISDVQNVVVEWKVELDEDTYIADVRLIDDQLYLVTGTYLNSYNCEIPLYQNIGRAQFIDCVDIYYPNDTVSNDQVFTVSKIDSVTGDLLGKVSFLGSYSNTVIYMSYDNIYVSYTKRESELNIFHNMYLDKDFDLFPSYVMDDINRIYAYDITDNSKYIEVENIINNYRRTLTDEEKELLDEKSDSYMEKYFNDHKRDFLSTGIVKISNDKLSLEATAQIPGTLLNSFSMDEYDDNLRVATTTDNYYTSESFNDLYILDHNLNQISSILDYGQDERIYAVRYMGEKAYVVTYRETDPLYIMDLSDTKDPMIIGELKIPGYSSFLHELSDGLLVGIGKEGSEVKVSLFDTSDTSNPKELDVLYLDEYWSNITSDHHAFLVDTKHKVFVVPVGDKATIISYANTDKLQVVLEVTNIDAVRSLYVDDYIYIIANSEIKVVDENTWEIVERFNF